MLDMLEMLEKIFSSKVYISTLGPFDLTPPAVWAWAGIILGHFIVLADHTLCKFQCLPSPRRNPLSKPNNLPLVGKMWMHYRRECEICYKYFVIFGFIQTLPTSLDPTKFRLSASSWKYCCRKLMLYLREAVHPIRTFCSPPPRKISLLLLCLWLIIPRFEMFHLSII